MIAWVGQLKVDTLERGNIQSDKDYIQNILNKYTPEKIVIGLPLNMNGSLGPQGEKVKSFANQLQEYYSGEIVFWDERLTSVSAHKTMIQADMSRKKRKQRVDQLAAVLILQSYLDYLNRK